MYFLMVTLHGDGMPAGQPVYRTVEQSLPVGPGTPISALSKTK